MVWDWVGWTSLDGKSLDELQKSYSRTRRAWSMNYAIEFNTIRKNIHQLCHIKLTDYSEIDDQARG